MKVVALVEVVDGEIRIGTDEINQFWIPSNIAQASTWKSWLSDSKLPGLNKQAENIKGYIGRLNQ